MSTENTAVTRPVGVWGGGIVGGVIGGIGMGIVLQFGANRIDLLGTFIGAPTVLGGWIAHLAFSVLFGMTFAALVSLRSVEELTDTFTSFVGLGFAYGVVLGLFNGGFLLPLALNRLGDATLIAPTLPIPGLAGELLFSVVLTLAHLVYGLLLGAVYATVNGAAPEALIDRRSAAE